MEVDWEQLAHSVVYIEAFCDGEWYSGSGTIVLDGEHVLTNHHVIVGDSGGFCDLTVLGMESLKDDLVFLAYGEVIPQALDYGLDLAVIRLVDTNGRPVKAAGRTPVEVIERELLLGEEMKVAGFPAMGGDTFTMTSGDIAGSWEDPSGYWSGAFYKTDAKMGPGISGGAAFSTDTGQFVGVPTGTPAEEDRGDILGLVRPARYAIQLLDAAERVD
jgi:putative serine protease PepD